MKKIDNSKSIFGKNPKLEDFNHLLDTYSFADEKQKSLWKEIYRNSIVDRDNAQLLFDHIVQDCTSSYANHAIYGVIAAKYLERLEKSNFQLIKLSELISEAKSDADSLNQDDIFDKIAGKK